MPSNRLQPHRPVLSFTNRYFNTCHDAIPQVIRRHGAVRKHKQCYKEESSDFFLILSQPFKYLLRTELLGILRIPEFGYDLICSGFAQYGYSHNFNQKNLLIYYMNRKLIITSQYNQNCCQSNSKDLARLCVVLKPKKIIPQVQFRLLEEL
jgi:hypothetical protein